MEISPVHPDWKRVQRILSSFGRESAPKARALGFKETRVMCGAFLRAWFFD